MLCLTLHFSLLSNLLLILALPNSPTVTLGHTKVIGASNSTTNIDFFGGIPFASPPVGALRFQPPVPQTFFPSNVTTFSAVSFGPGVSSAGIFFLRHFFISEDCLTVNVFRPAGTSVNSKLPVMFWAFGGGFHEGAPQDFDPSTLIARSVSRGTPIVYVSFNYRLGPFGFPQGNEVDATGDVNLGIKDLLAALKWVQVNIQAFGGDLTKVTVFGESAGAVLHSVLVLNSQISGLARGAIFASSSPATPAAHTAPQRESLWESFVAGVPSCAADAPVAELLLSYQQVGVAGWLPVIDGPGGVFSATPSILYAQGNLSHIPFITGDVLDEELSDQIDKLLVLYPDDPALGSPYNTGNETFGLDSGWKRAASLVGDLVFHSTRRMFLQAAASRGSKVYSYLLTQPQLLGDSSLGVSHPVTKNYVYGTVLNDGIPSDAAVSIAMMEYWLSFASSLDPNDGKGTARPYLGAVLLQLNGGENQTVMIKDDFRAEGIDAINSKPLVFYH
ncbi:extracellular triacylglycerol lipase precursor [Mycena olivaceomarginata]|nr:extracellular triacylglycerol lipase precursor [Mycena olivaceomarginata]